MGFIHLADAANAVPLSFPGLNMMFSLNREAIFIGPLTIYWYGIIVVTGIALGVAYAIWRAGQFGIDRDKYSDMLLISIAFSLVGARAYYVIFSWDYYKDHFDEIVKIWNGGIAFYGGIMAALLCAYLVCKLWKLPFVKGADAALGGVMVGQSIGRWGNFVNIEAFGGYYEGMFRMTSPVIDNYLHAYPEQLVGFTAEEVLAMSDIPVHPTFLYESTWTMLGFLFIVWYTKRRKFVGELALMYFFINGLGRMFIEGLRTDSLTVGNIRVSQMLATCMVVVSAVLWMAANKKVKAGTAPAWMSIKLEASEVVSEETSDDLVFENGEVSETAEETVIESDTGRIAAEIFDKSDNDGSESDDSDK